jgi:predicted aldo/keto reductase-like oxidoreductase
MMDVDWNKRRRGAMDVLAEARERKIVRTHGVSCHSLEALKTAAREPWVQVDLARLNPAQVAMDAPVPTVVSVLKEMKAAGKGIIGMKILGAGRLRNRVDECLQYALAQDVLDCFTIGSESRAEFEDLLQKIPAASVRG